MLRNRYKILPLPLFFTNFPIFFKALLFLFKSTKNIELITPNNNALGDCQNSVYKDLGIWSLFEPSLYVIPQLPPTTSIYPHLVRISL